jgi:hypothetical protein
VRELHKELKRVGCYQGEVGGSWTQASRQAMRRFTQSVNAKLPLEEPDLILLRLVESHRQTVCTAGCAADRPDGAMGGACRERTAAAEPPTPAQSQARGENEPAEKPTPLLVGAATTTAAAAATAAAVATPQLAPTAPASTAKPASAPAPQAPLAIEEEQRAGRAQRQTGPQPPDNVYRRRHEGRRADSRPPVVVESLVRNVQRALGSLGIR